LYVARVSSLVILQLCLFKNP